MTAISNRGCSHADQAKLAVSEELDHLLAAQLPSQLDLAATAAAFVDAVALAFVSGVSNVNAYLLNVAALPGYKTAADDLHTDLQSR